MFKLGKAELPTDSHPTVRKSRRMGHPHSRPIRHLSADVRSRNYVYLKFFATGAVEYSRIGPFSVASNLVFAVCAPTSYSPFCPSSLGGDSCRHCGSRKFGIADGTIPFAHWVQDTGS